MIRILLPCAALVYMVVYIGMDTAEARAEQALTEAQKLERQVQRSYRAFKDRRLEELNTRAEELALHLDADGWTEFEKQCLRFERQAAKTLKTDTDELRLCAKAAKARRELAIKAKLVSVEQFLRSL